MLFDLIVQIFKTGRSIQIEIAQKRHSADLQKFVEQRFFGYFFIFKNLHKFAEGKRINFKDRIPPRNTILPSSVFPTISAYTLPISVCTVFILYLRYANFYLFLFINSISFLRYTFYQSADQRRIAYILNTYIFLYNCRVSIKRDFFRGFRISDRASRKPDLVQICSRFKETV